MGSPNEAIPHAPHTLPGLGLRDAAKARRYCAPLQPLLAYAYNSDPNYLLESRKGYSLLNDSVSYRRIHRLSPQSDPRHGQ